MKRFALVIVAAVLVCTPLHARQKMDFLLFNLGSGADGVADFEKMATQFSAVIAPMFHGEAESRGAEGFELGIGYSFTKIDYSARYWTNALNDKPTDMQVPTFYNGIDIHVKKGFSFGMVIYGNVRYYILSEMISGGLGAEYVVNEGLKNWPDVSFGAGYNGLFGGYDLNMHQVELRLKLSKTFIAKKEVKLIPFFAYSHVFSFAWSNRLGGYWDISGPSYGGAAYYGDRSGTPFQFDDVFINVDRLVIGFKFMRANFGMTIDGTLPFNAYKAFSMNAGFSVVF